MFDDDFLGPGNPGVRAGLSPAGLRYAWGNLIGFWHPLTWMSLQLDAELYGQWPGGFHVTNILIHGASALLLFAILRAMTGAVWPSAMAAGLFAVHPLNVEPVAWIAERRGIVATFFWMLAMSAYTRYSTRPGLGRFIAVASAMTLSLMAKATAVTLPFALLLLDYWPLGRLDSGSWLPRVREKLPLVVLAGAFVIVTVVAERASGALGWLDVPLPARLANAVVSYARYLGMAVWPVGLSPFYPHTGPRLAPAAVIAALGVLTIGTAAALWLRRRRPYATVGWLWYVVTLLPVIGFVQVGRHGLADRYTYVPMIGIWIVAAWALAEAARLWQCWRLAAPIGCAAVAACLVLSRGQAACWHDGETLWQHALDADPQNPVAHNSLGVAVSGTKPEAALEHFRAAVSLDPEYAIAHYNLGMALGRRGELSPAVAEFREAVRLSPRYVEAHYNLGVALARLGRARQAADAFAAATRLNPADAKSHHNLAVALHQLGRDDEAGRHEAEARRLEAQGQ